MRIARHILLPLCLMASFGCYTAKPPINLEDIRRYEYAASQGDPIAQYHLGMAYQTHLRYSEADLWLLKAAQNGVPEAQYSLAENYSAGLGVPKNIIEAYAWYSVADTQGNLPSTNARNTLTAKLTRSELENGDRRSEALLTMIASRKLLYGLTLTAVERYDDYTPEPTNGYGYYRSSNDYDNHVKAAPKSVANSATAPAPVAKTTVVAASKPAYASTSTPAPAPAVVPAPAGPMFAPASP
jgi:hypothetical protein